MGGYLVFCLVNLVVMLAGGGGDFGLRQGPLGFAIGLFAVGLAAAMLILDFDFAEQGVKNGIPERYSWLAAFGAGRHAGLALHRDAAPDRDPARRLAPAARLRNGPHPSGVRPARVPRLGQGAQPATVGPARSIEKRTRTRFSSSIACRYSSQSGCSPEIRR